MLKGTRAIGGLLRLPKGGKIVCIKISCYVIPMTTTTRDSTIHKTAALFHALSDETRLAIVERLREGERCVCDLTDLLDAAQSRLSFHLKVLKEAGVVDCRKEGRWAYYWLRPEAFDLLQEASKELRPSRAAVQASRAQGCG